MREAARKLAPCWAKKLYGMIMSTRPAGRMLSVRKDDVFIVSYPKSGNTWTRFLIANIVYRGAVEFANIEKLVPDIYVNPEKKLRTLPSPRYIKSHESFDPRYRKVILIVRDPRDVAVSYLHFLRKHRRIPDEQNIDSYIEQFVQGGLDDYGSWGENTGSWLGARERDENLLVLRYEDMLADTRSELVKILKFIGKEMDDNEIERAIEYSSFDRMKELEKAQSKQWRATRNTRQDVPFMRSGKSGDWKSALTAEAAARIEGKWGALMKKLGYL